MLTLTVRALCLGVAALLVSTSPYAALLTRLGGLAVYDSDLNITWLADANLAQSQTFGVAGISSVGQMNWYTANDWVSAMNTANYLGFNDWRLPTTVQPDISCSLYGAGLAYIGGPGCDVGEMGHLYYDEFGGAAGIGGAVGDPGNPIERAKFTNIQAVKYWTSTTFASDADQAWDFSFTFGSQDTLYKADAPLHVWVVRDGDIGAVPLPAAVWLLGAGALGLIGIARRRL